MPNSNKADHYRAMSLAYADGSWRDMLERKQRSSAKRHSKRRQVSLAYLGTWSRSSKLEFLLFEANRGHAIPTYLLVKRRSQFDQNKANIFDLTGAKCWICKAPAEIRHHVRPLWRGGRNRHNNIVALCESCHATIHPWMIDQEAKSIREFNSLLEQTSEI